jgi:monofunctional biosynthetic peptidoglycan transglycosylase
VLRLVRSLILGLLVALLCVPSMTVAQVLWVGLLDPPGTATTVERVLAHWGSGRWGLPSHRARSLEALGPHVPRAVVAAEDARFFLHDGFDWESVCDALGDAGRGKRLRGASTITQQVAKNVFLWQGRSWARKAAEVWYVLLLEQLLSKERILELYLGVAETGPLVFGLEAGAQHHYKKPAHELTADQAARLAGILPDPLDRKPSGKAASDRARWIHANPAPFPGDKHYDLVLAKWEKEAVHPWQCLF